MTGNEKTAMNNILHAINWIVGGYYNDVQDAHEEDLPESREALEAEIYEAAMTNRYDIGLEAFGKAPKEMRFAGEAFCKAFIKKCLDKDEDLPEIAKAANW